jgi:hypothetical protein
MYNNIETPQKLKMEESYFLETPLLFKHTKKVKSICGKDTYTPMFIAALFTIAKR